MALSDVELARELYELIQALDRRVPRIERAGEVSIARDAAAIRAKAVARLGKLAFHNTGEVVPQFETLPESAYLREKIDDL